MEVVGWFWRLQVKGQTGPSDPHGARRDFSRRKLGRRQSRQRAVWPVVGVVIAEGFEQTAGVVEVEELVFVEAFVAELAVEALDVGVLGRLSRSDEVMLDPVLMGPAFEGQAGKLRSVVGEQAGGPAPQFGNVVEHPRHPRTGQRGVGLDSEAFAGVVVDDRKQPQGAAVDQPVVEEVQAPAFIGADRCRRLDRAPGQPLLAAPALPHLQALGPVEPMDPLVVVRKAFPAQQDQQPSVTPAPAHGGMPP